MKGILGRKIGMTQVFSTDGKLVPVTVIEVNPNVVTQIKTLENDGYEAVQLGYEDVREKVSNKAKVGHTKKANTAPKRFLKEIRVDSVEGYTLGSTLAADTFTVGEKVDVTGTSKGKGYAGPIKRHGLSRGPETHGSHYHRRPGSLGTMLPMHVLKGQKLAGHMGHETVTIQNLEIIEVSTKDNYILVSGSVPGPKNSLVLIRDAVKGGAVEPKEIIIYEVEEEVAPVEEATTEEVVETATEEVVEETTTEATEEVAAEEAPAEEVAEETADEKVEETTEA